MNQTPDSDTIDAALAPLIEMPERSAILSDIDGTLAAITDRPEQTAIPEATRELLARLRDRYALIGCVSGRRATEAARIIGLDGICYSGNHGLELLKPGDRESHVDLALRGHEHAAAIFTDNLDGAKLAAAGIRVEDKGPIQGLHWRGAGDEAAAAQLLREIAEQATIQDLHVHWGRKVLEIRPASGVGKDAAMTALLEDPNIRHAIYGGDDITDLDAFSRMREMVEEGLLDTAVCVGVTSAEGPPEVKAESDLTVPDQAGWALVLSRLDR